MTGELLRGLRNRNLLCNPSAGIYLKPLASPLGPQKLLAPRLSGRVGGIWPIYSKLRTLRQGEVLSEPVRLRADELMLV